MGALSDSQTPDKVSTDGTSNSDGGYFNSRHKIVSIDIPDPDNFLAALQILKDFPGPGYKISIILSPRPVSFAAPLFNLPSLSSLTTEPKDKFNKIPTFFNVALSRYKSNQGGEVDKDATKNAFFDIIRPLPSDDLPEWAQAAEKGDYGWLYRDLDAKNAKNAADTSPWKDSEKDIYEDSKIYLDLSAHRLAAFLSANGIPRSDYNVYCDINSLENITVGMRHAFHKHDFTYGFDEEERKLYDELVGSNGRDGAPNAKLRKGLREICNKYITRMKTRFPQAVEGLNTLIDEYKEDCIIPDIFVAGPFTETLKYIQQNGPFKNLHILAMGGFIHGELNLFPNQFNFHADMASAKTLLELIEDSKDYSLTLLPTECVKESRFSLKPEDLKHWPSPSTVDLITQYYKGERSQVYNLFDWVTALTIKHPDLLVKKEVQHRVEGRDPGIIKFEAKQEEWTPVKKNGGRIFMYQDEVSHMERQRGNLLKAMEETLKRGIGSGSGLPM